MFSEEQNAPIYVLFKLESGSHVQIARLSRVATGKKSVVDPGNYFLLLDPPYGLRNQTPQ
jgi:hypothetical protein